MGDAKMRAAFFNPYLDTGGGGERYFLSAAVALKKAKWSVEIQWKDPKIIPWLEERFGLDLSGIEIVSDISKGSGYDLCFWLSDGSVPLLFSKKNILHFQTPFTKIGGKSVLNKLKFMKIDKVICNSSFTKGFIDKEFGIESEVLYPPVSIQDFKGTKKENIILSVGRFSQLQQQKRQDVLVNTFKALFIQGLKNWQLILIGASEIGGKDYVTELKRESKGYPIKILENLPFSEIKRYYGKSKIFWSASGFNVNSNVHPEKVEHFGITTVEAMAGEVVPVIVDNGGHKEIIIEGETGFLWKTIDDLENITLQIIRDERRRKIIAKKAKNSSIKFSQKDFEDRFLEIII